MPHPSPQRQFGGEKFAGLSDLLLFVDVDGRCRWSMSNVCSIPCRVGFVRTGVRFCLWLCLYRIGCVCARSTSPVLPLCAPVCSSVCQSGVWVP